LFLSTKQTGTLISSHNNGLYLNKQVQTQRID
jgi:hypothetical protein